MLVAWTALLLWMGVIYWFSAQTATESKALSTGFVAKVAEAVTPSFEKLPPAEQAAVVESWQTVVRKGGHLAEFALLGLLAFIALSFHILHPWKRAAVAAGVGLLNAIGDEVHQIFVQGRGPGVLDVVIDFAGVCLGIGVCLLIATWWSRRKQKKAV